MRPFAMLVEPILRERSRAKINKEHHSRNLELLSEVLSIDRSPVIPAVGKGQVQGLARLGWASAH